MTEDQTDRSPQRPGSPVADLSYTEASRELDEIVAFFEQRDVDVDQLVARLERATAIVDELDRRLRRTRAQVEELVPQLEAAAGPAGRAARRRRRPRLKPSSTWPTSWWTRSKKMLEAEPGDDPQGLCLMDRSHRGVTG